MTPHETISLAVAERFNAIRHTLIEREGDYIYNGHRTEADELGWRFRQNHPENPGLGLLWPGYQGMELDIIDGKHDAMIEAAWHDAASAAYWYRYEKDYGSDDEPIEEPDDADY